MAQDDGSFKAWNGKVIRKNEKRDVALIKVQGKLKNYFSTSKIVKQGKILSLDLKKIAKLKNVSFLQSDFLETKTKKKYLSFLAER